MTHKKRNYHPLIPILYAKGLLGKQQLNKIPKRTLQHWNKNKNKSYDFDSWVMPFEEHIEGIKKNIRTQATKKSNTVYHQGKRWLSPCINQC